MAGRSDSAGMSPAAASGRLVEFAAYPLDISLIAYSSPLKLIIRRFSASFLVTLGPGQGSCPGDRSSL